MPSVVHALPDFHDGPLSPALLGILAPMRRLTHEPLLGTNSTLQNSQAILSRFARTRGVDLPRLGR